MRPPDPDDLENLIRAAIDAGDPSMINFYSDQLDAWERGQPQRIPSLAGSALWYVAQGLKVFPLKPGDKRPYSRSHGLKDGSDDPDQIRAWWTERPTSNVAIVTGHLVDVIDVDGPAGVKSWAALAEHDYLGEIVGIVNTPRPGGTHLYRPVITGGNKAGMGPGLDYRGTGGYVVAPPSVNAAGKRYTWHQPLQIPRKADHGPSG